jgi:hypothetical protein
MINEANLKDTLLSFATENRTQYIMLTSILNELVALRETVRGLDPTFGDVMRERQEQAAQTGVELNQSILAGYDLIIQKLTEGHVC